ncbi:MAG: phospho-N-acetylmuramoyl-pentapeptide-transferase [Chloroflexi bacterium]|nr:MAG: phospho-N-acetylmuramoyl-pentapeptide-transferase [Chloroflexota bacterium]
MYPWSYALVLGTISFLSAVIWGGPLIHQLRERGIGKGIRIDGPRRHQVKMGTPTMGGLLFLVPVFVITVVLNLVNLLGFNIIGQSILMPLAVMVAYGVLGAIDDLAGLASNGDSRTPVGIGLLARHMLMWQIAIATVVALVLHFGPTDLHSLALPTVPERIDIGRWWIPVAIFIIVGTANAVNISDGLDGLAGGLSAIAFIAFGVIAFQQGQIFLLRFCLTVVGAILAFLWYNAYPADLFMGNTGSLALGATLAVVALMTGQWLMLPIVGAVFVAEVLSDILQIAYFKLTGGKRLFRMAPIHHHFELLGWSEVQVVQRFWLIGMLAAMVGIALALL